MRVSGQVTDLETKEGVADVLVRLVDHESVLVQANTGPDGRYELALDLQARPQLVGRPGQVKASKEGFEPALEDFQLADRDYAIDLSIHSKPETLVVFVNQLDGKPIEDVEVLFTLGGKTMLGDGLTDGQGLISFHVPAHRLDQQALLKVSKDGWYKVERLVLLTRNQPRVQVTLEPRTTGEVPLSGRIFDDKGRPLAGARVTLELPRKAPVLLITDAEGRWSLVLEPDLYGHEGLLHAEHADYHPARGIKLPLMPNAMHVVPMNPLQPASPSKLPWLLAAAVLLAALFFGLRAAGLL
jgi:hypothetical protein